jgi:putative colanic acid biosynthesis UDP-glucose lipid carrier transferase
MLTTAQPSAFSRSRTSIVGLVRMSVEPVLIVAMLVVSCAATGVEFGAAEVVLGLIVFSLTFPGEISVRRLRQSLFLSILTNWLLIAALCAFFGWATRYIWIFDGAMLLVWFVATPLALYGAHRAIPLLMPQLLAIDGFRSAVIVAANDVSCRLATHLRDEPSLGYRFLGFFDDRRDVGRRPPQQHGPVLGAIGDTAEYVKRHGVETVFIALPMAAQPRVLKLLDDMRDTTASIYFVPDVFIADLVQARIDDVNGVPVLAVCETPFVGINGMLKWASDVVAAATLLVVLAPLMALIAVGVRLSSPGSIIFRQRRYGLDGREIVVWKFRSMTVNEDGAQIAQATANDRRVTRFGAFLRKSSLDELPQLINVLQGRMSLVGPRPHAVAHNEQYRRLISGYMVRHKVKPGITGWAQVNGLRGETDTVDKMRKRIEYDLDYLRRWSLGFDVSILLKTALIVWRRTNAH